MSPVWDGSNQPWTDEFFKLLRKRLRIPFRKFQTLEQFRVGCRRFPQCRWLYLYYGLFSETFWSFEFIFNVTFKPVKNNSHMCKREQQQKRRHGNFHLLPPAIGSGPTRVCTGRTYQPFNECHVLCCVKKVGGLGLVGLCG